MNEDELLKYTYGNPPDYDALKEIGQYMLTTFSEFMGQELACFKEHYVDTGAAVLNVRHTEPMPGPFALQWDGLLLYGVRDEHPAMDAYIFLFSHGERVARLYDRGDGWMIYTYEIAEGKGQWSFDFWHGDEYGEWTYVDKPRRDMYDKFERTYD